MGFKAFVNHCRALVSSPVNIGERVRLVDKDGCMAHIRNNIREGKVVGIKAKQVYGDTKVRPYVKIQLDEGYTVERCGDAYLWTRYEDGVMEYLD